MRIRRLKLEEFFSSSKQSNRRENVPLRESENIVLTFQRTVFQVFVNFCNNFPSHTNTFRKAYDARA